MKLTYIICVSNVLCEMTIEKDMFETSSFLSFQRQKSKVKIYKSLPLWRQHLNLLNCSQ